MRFSATASDPAAALAGTEKEIAIAVTAGMREVTEGLKQEA